MITKKNKTNKKRHKLMACFKGLHKIDSSDMMGTRLRPIPSNIPLLIMN